MDERPTLARAGDVIVVEATPEELPALLAVQKEAFSRVARQFDLPFDRMPPITESLEDLERFLGEGMRFLVALDPDGQVVGTVRGCSNAEKTVEVGRLAVDERALRRGIARALMTALESSFPDAKRFELFTGAEARAPLALYEQLGYHVFRSGDPRYPFLVWLEKPGPAA